MLKPLKIASKHEGAPSTSARDINNHCANSFADAHCHLAEWSGEGASPVLVRPYSSGIEACRAAGISTVLFGGYDPEDWSRQIACRAATREICPAFNVFMAFGLHPWAVNKLTHPECTEALLLLRSSLREPERRPQAIGECGLDFSRLPRQEPKGAKTRQQEIFRIQCVLAAEEGLPIVVHSVRAMAATLEILSEYSPKLKGALIHGFSGDKGVIARYLKHGPAGRTFFSVGPASFGGGDSAMKSIPPEFLLVESDGRFNEGEGARRLLEVAESLSRARGEPPANILERSNRNLMKFLGL